MFKWERKLWVWLYDHLDIVLVAGGTIISLMIRWSMRDFISRDMTQFLLPWYESIKRGGGFSALGAPVGNYNMPYQTLIAILTYIPISPKYLYKISSSIFDFLQAIFVYKIVNQITEDKLKASLGYAFAINLPTVLMNSTLWGQCDSIYSSFCLISLFYCLNDKHVRSMLCVGIASAFKLQAVFFLPFLLFIYAYKKRFSIVQFIWIPLVMVILSLGGILQGQTIGSVFEIYHKQTLDLGEMSVNYPSLWALMIENRSKEYYSDMRWCGILLTVFAILVLIILFIHKKQAYSISDLLEISFLLVYTCVFMLPGMHERYGYLYIMLGLVAAIVRHRLIPSYVVLLIIDLIVYSKYLFKYETNWQMLAAMNALCFSITTAVVLMDVTCTNTFLGKKQLTTHR